MAWSDEARRAALEARRLHSGTYLGMTAKGKRVRFKFRVRARDPYHAGDLIKAMAEKKYGAQYYPVIKFKAKKTYKISRAGRSAVRNAGPEED